MAKAFDLIHKVAQPEEPKSRIPFEENQSTDPSTQPVKNRPRIEIAFFYLLLFTVFFIMGMTFLTPNLLSRFGKKSTAEPSPQASAGPVQGFTIEQEGQKVSEAAKELGIGTPTPSISSSPSPTITPSAPSDAAATTTSKAAKIQILNGTTKEGAAAAMRQKLAQEGIVVASIGNYQKRSVSRTTIYYRPDYKKAAQDIQAVVGGVLSETTTGIGSYDILVVVGQR